ncbi:MAG TPA: riboflavin synthase [Candidatus Angelobacter sp.]|nr:riboflavin synthase [Candidatus Angelobacter sp.]
MFTGLIQGTGRISDLRELHAKKSGTLTRITIAAAEIPRQLQSGDSVAVSGVCLTAIEIKGKQFCADLAEETVQRTSLVRLKKGSLVNLELPARPQDHLGGHIVQGHVDGVGKMVSLAKIKGRDDWRLAVEIPAPLARYVVAQGSIAFEGISLTVAAIAGNRLEVAIIPHTWEATNLHDLRPGDPVNVEVDVLAKYVEKMVSRHDPASLKREELIRRGF